jgi:hypothetical protein
MDDETSTVTVTVGQKVREFQVNLLKGLFLLNFTFLSKTNIFIVNRL